MRQLVDLRGIDINIFKKAFEELKNSKYLYLRENLDNAFASVKGLPNIKYIIDVFGEDEVKKYIEVIACSPYSPHEFAVRLARTPIDHKNRILGSGLGGVVFDKGDKVIKIYHPHGLPPSYSHQRKWLEYAKDHFGEHPSLPHIYKLNEKYLIMEKLDVGKIENVPALNEFLGYKRGENYTQQFKEFNEMYVKATGTCSENSDIMIRNIGVRPGTQDIVLFDP